MTPSPFERRLRAAIESRQPIDSWTNSDRDRSNEEEWRRQVRLDHAIAAWKQHAERGARRRRQMRRLACTAVLAAMVLTEFGIAPHFRESHHSGKVAVADRASATAPLKVPSTPRPAPDRRIVSPALAHFAPPADLESELAPSDADADFHETADRLVYAIEPVGRHVSAMVTRLIDAVPGADVLATSWRYES